MEPLRWLIVPVVEIRPAVASIVPRCSKVSAEIVKVPVPVCSMRPEVSLVSMLPVPTASAMSPSPGTVMMPWLNTCPWSCRKIEFVPLMDTVPGTLPTETGSRRSSRVSPIVRELSTSRRPSSAMMVRPAPRCVELPLIVPVPEMTRSPAPVTMPPDCVKVKASSVVALSMVSVPPVSVRSLKKSAVPEASVTFAEPPMEAVEEGERPPLKVWDPPVAVRSKGVTMPLKTLVPPVSSSCSAARSPKMVAVFAKRAMLVPAAEKSDTCVKPPAPGSTFAAKSTTAPVPTMKSRDRPEVPMFVIGALTEIVPVPVPPFAASKISETVEFALKSRASLIWMPMVSLSAAVTTDTLVPASMAASMTVSWIVGAAAALSAVNTPVGASVTSVRPPAPMTMRSGSMSQSPPSPEVAPASGVVVTSMWPPEVSMKPPSPPFAPPRASRSP